ncbi:MAG: efflux RND transporter periplasmic adaptor subunit [Methylacidiphilales bacterium]|nr:efflux RND transporter periplasmic adaptor subunit [Candidatus Methylacidiphilales bacterium]
MRGIYFGTAGLLFALLPLACERKADVPPPRLPVNVSTALAVSKPVPLYIDEIGTCVALQSVSILPQVSGAIAKIHFEDGAELKQGDPLFTIDPRLFEAARDKAEATLLSDQATLELNRAQLKRSQELAQGNYISAQDLENLKTTVATSEAVVQGDRAALKTAQINLEYCTMNSPIDGKAGIHQVDIGAVVTAYSNTPLVSIQRLDPLYVDFVVAETDLPQVRNYFKTGALKVEVYYPEAEQKKRSGELFFLDNAVQTGSGTVKLRAILHNEDHFFWPGQFVNVRLLLDTIQNAVLVPYEAVQVGNNGPFAFIVKGDNTVELRFVKPGQRQGDQIVVSDGIKQGEMVVVTGQLSLAPGAKVMPSAATK